MTGPGSEEVSRAKRNICGKVDDWTCTGSEEVSRAKRNICGIVDDWTWF
jgi:hypothetical protein